MPPLPRARRRAMRRRGIVAQIETSCLPPSPPEELEPSSEPASAALALSAEPTPVLAPVQGTEESAIEAHSTHQRLEVVVRPGRESFPSVIPPNPPVDTGDRGSSRPRPLLKRLDVSR